MTIIYNAILLDESMHEEGVLILKGKKIFCVLKGNFKNCDAVLKEAKIACKKNAHFIDAKGLTVAPAFIDMHAHFRYPGQTQKEDLQSALNAAAAGGFGTLVLMPNTNPVVSSLAAAKDVCDKAAQKKMSRVFQCASITKNFDGKTVAHIETLDKKKVPVISEDGQDVANAAVLFDGMCRAAKKGIIVACHCEDAEFAIKACEARKKAVLLLSQFKLNLNKICDKKNLSQIPKTAIAKIKKNIATANAFLELAEDIATERNIAIAKKAACKIHICHVSTKGSIKVVRRAKADFIASGTSKKNANSLSQITCEITPHHLALFCDNKNIFKFVNPPLRSQKDRAALIEALRDGTADVIATDHAPHTAADKATGAAGFSGLETAYAICNTVLVKKENFFEQRLSQLMSANPARILGLKKGLLKEGFDADIVLLNPNEKWKVDSSQFFSKGKNTPLEGKTLFGKVKAIFVEGKKLR